MQAVNAHLGVEGVAGPAGAASAPLLLLLLLAALLQATHRRKGAQPIGRCTSSHCCGSLGSAGLWQHVLLLEILSEKRSHNKETTQASALASTSLK